MRFLLTLFIAMIFPSLVWAHGAPKGEGFFQEDAYLELIRKATHLQPVNRPTSGSVAVAKVNGHLVALDTAFFTLARGWLNIYFNELQTSCKVNQKLKHSMEEMIQSAQDQAARGVISTNLIAPIRRAAEHISDESAELGGMYGNEALGLKVAAEVAETVGSKVIGGAGVHILCNLIDAAIIFGMRRVQVTTRLLLSPSSWERGVVRSTLTYWFARRKMKVAKKRLGFLTAPFELDEEGLALHNEYARKPKRPWKTDSYRTLWIKWFDRRSEKLNLQRQQILTALNEEPLNFELQNQLEKIDRKLYSISQIRSTRGFRNKKHRFHFLKTKGQLETVLNGNRLNKGILWGAMLQEGVLDKGVQYTDLKFADNPSPYSLIGSWQPDSESQEVFKGLIEEQTHLNTPEQRDLLLSLMKDVSFTFDAKNDRNKRLLNVEIIEAVLAQMLFKMVSHSFNHFDQHPESWFAKRKSVFTTKLRSGLFARYVYHFTDDLRIWATSTDQTLLDRRKFESAEVLTRIFQHVHTVQKLLEQDISAQELNVQLKDLNEKLFQFAPWKRKKKKLAVRYPQCEAFWEDDH